jgi:tetratricopeptide (TPR) repeat protein
MRMVWTYVRGDKREAGRSLVRVGALIVLLVVASVGVWAGGCGDPTDKARELENAGDWQGALGVYQRVLADQPDNLAALSGGAVALVMLRRYDEALDLQERVIAADAEDALTRVELGFNYLSYQGRPMDAVRVLSEAVELEPTAKNMTFLSQAQKAAGDLEECERSLRKAILVDPGYGYAYGRLAGLLTEEGRMDEATQVIEDARSRGLYAGDQR